MLELRTSSEEWAFRGWGNTLTQDPEWDGGCEPHARSVRRGGVGSGKWMVRWITHFKTGSGSLGSWTRRSNDPRNPHSTHFL